MWVNRYAYFIEMPLAIRVTNRNNSQNIHTYHEWLLHICSKSVKYDIAVHLVICCFMISFMRRMQVADLIGNLTVRRTKDMQRGQCCERAHFRWYSRLLVLQRNNHFHKFASVVFKFICILTLLIRIPTKWKDLFVFKCGQRSFSMSVAIVVNC